MFVPSVNKSIWLIVLLISGFCDYSSYSYAQNLSDISITITFQNAPQEYNVSKAPLKYNKKFALSMQVDDGNNSIYQLGFPVFEGGEASGGGTYPGMFFSDGCGNSKSFKMTSAIYMFASNGTDVHSDPGSNFITWPQLDTLYKYQWGIANKGVNTDNSNNTEFINYSINRNRSYCRRKMYNSTPGGVIPTVFVNPGGNTTWSLPAFELGSIAAFNSANNGPLGDFGGDVNNPDFNWAQFNYNIFRVNPGNQNIPDMVDKLASQSVDSANFWGVIYTSSILNDYVFSRFVSDFEYIENTYGSSGTDEILMTTDVEILNYLMVRDAITVNSTLTGNELTLTLSGLLPDDLLYYASSIVVNSTEVINNIIIEGTGDFTFSNVGDTTALININWDEYVVPSPIELASSYTATAINSQLENDALIAMDYVTVLDFGDAKNDLVNQLCGITGVTFDDGFCTSGYPDFVRITGDSVILSGEEATLTATDFLDSYLWNNGQTTRSIAVTPQTNTSYWVDAVTKNGNNVNDTIVVVVSDSYVLTHSPMYVQHTVGEPDSIWVTLRDGATSSWSTGSTQNYIIVDPNVSTVYKLDVLLDNIIVNQFEFVVYVENVIEFTYDSVCFNDITTLINTSVVNDSITKILWDLNGNTQFNDAEGDTVKYVFAQAGNHLVGMRVYFKTDPIDIVYNAVPVGDLPSANFDYKSTCLGSTTVFTDLSSVQVGVVNRWLWRFGDGGTDSNQEASNYYSNVGNYNVMLTAWTSLGCKDSIQKIIQITDSPNIEIKTSTDTIVGNNDTVYFNKGGTVNILVVNFANYDSVIWFDGSRAESVTIAEEGNFYVNVYQNGCRAKSNFSTLWGNAPPPVGNDIMNLFTPNGDGINDLWVVNDPKIVSPAAVNVYNRSGKQIFSSNNYQNTWDGQYEGNPLPQATYYYVITDGSGAIFKGAVTIIR